MPAPSREVPSVESWPAWVNNQVARQRKIAPGEGVHRLFNGQTRSGKTTLNKILLRMKKTTLVLGTKPKHDAALERYVSEEGFVRIDHWPPTTKELKQRGQYEQVKLLLWPKVKEYAQLRGFAPLFRRALQDVQIDGNWTVSIDEGLWVCARKGLDLGDVVSEIAIGGAGNGLSLHVLVQRPRNIDPIIYSSCHEGYLFKAGNENDLRELASYTSYSSRDLATAVKGLNLGNEERGHQFLYAPLSGGSKWSVSEVPSDWA